MLGEWRQIQREVWELDASAQHLQASSRSCLEQLLRQRRYSAELGLAARRFRRVCTAGTGPGAQLQAQEDVEPLELEDLAGRDAAQVWAGFLQALARRPGALPVLARAAGYTAHELLAGLAAGLVGDPVSGALGGACPAAQVLEEILGAEFAQLNSEEELHQAATLFTDGTFLSAMLQELTSHDPACMIWARSVSSPDVLESIARLLRAAPSRNRHGSNNQAVRRAQSLNIFLGEAPQSSDDSSPLCHAASAIVASMCEWASAAPLGLCRLAAALSRQLKLRYRDAGVSERNLPEAQHLLLGSLILGRWLVPTLLAPGVGFVLHGDAGSRSALTTLAKLLRAIAAPAAGGARGWGGEDGAALGGASASFVSTEAQRLGKGLFDVLLERGAWEEGREDDGYDLAWPQCIVCTSADLATLSRAFLKESVASTVAESLSLPMNAVRALSRLIPQTDAPVDVVCWLQREIEAMADIALDRSRSRGVSDAQSLMSLARRSTTHSDPQPQAQSRFQSFVSTDSDVSDPPVPELPKPTSLQSLEVESSAREEPAESGRRRQRLSTATSEPGSVDGGDEMVILPLVSALDEGAGLETSMSHGLGLSNVSLNSTGEESDDELRMGLMLLWQVLADPRPLDGPAHATLMQALDSSHLQLGNALPHQLRVGMLAEFLRSRCDAAPMRTVEVELLRGLQTALARQRQAVAQGRGALARLQVAERLIRDSCTQAKQALRQHVRLVADLRCNACLQALWAAAPPVERGLAAGQQDHAGGTPSLELCVVGPPLDLWVAKSRAGGLDCGKAKGTGLAVKVFERSRCPCHCVATLSASMGFDSRLEDGFKHWSVRSLSQVVKVFRKLPLETAVLHRDPFGIAAAVRSTLEQTVAHVIKEFRLAPVVTASEACTIYSMGPVGTQPAGNFAEDWTRPAALTQMDSSHVRDCVARFLFAHLHPRLFPSEPTAADLQLAERARLLRWLQPKHLDLPAAAVQSLQVERAGQTLQGLHRLRSPEQMLAELSSAFRTVTEAACIRAQVQANTNGKAGDAFGADSALPLFILVVIRANPPMFSSVLAYAECFIAPTQRLTEQGYALTQAHASAKFTKTARPEDLNSLEPGEWERHMGSPGTTGAI